MKRILNFLNENRRFSLLLLAEAILLLAHFALALQVQTPVTVTGSEMTPAVGSAFVDEAGGMAVVNSEDYGPYLRVPAISVKKGTYKVTLHYSTNFEGSKLRQSNPYVICTDQLLDPYTDTLTFSMWAQGDTIAEFDVTNNGGSRSIYSITVTPTRAYAKVSFLKWLLFFALADLLILVKKKKLPCCRWDYSTRLLWAGLAAVIAFSSLPLFMDFIFSGHDLAYHLGRIQGIADGLAAHMFPVKVQPTLLNGNGYASGIFYGDLFLYFPAVLRLIGFSLQTSYKLYAVAVNTATALISYFCFEKLLQNHLGAFAGAAMYTLSSYRMVNLYVRGAVGEYSAMIFFPLIFYALYEIFTREPDSPGYRWLWLPGMIGYCGLICTHILSCAMAAIFTVIACLIYIKKIFRPGTFLVLAKIVVYTALSCLWFLVPFADYMLHGDFLLSSDSHGIWSTLDQSLFPGQLFDIFTRGDGISCYLHQTLCSETTYSIGAAILLATGLFLFLSLDSSQRKDSRFTLAWGTLALGVLAAWMTTTLFPWFGLSEMLPPLGTIISTMQFPWRFLVMATLFLTVTGSLGISILSEKDLRTGILATAGILLIAFLTTGYFYHDVYDTNPGDFGYDLQDINTHYGIDPYGRLASETGSAEYLPTGANLDTFWTYTRPIYDADALSLTEYSKQALTITAHAENLSGTDQLLTLPLTHYKDYNAVDLADGTSLVLDMDPATCQLRLTLPAGYSGTFRVRFTEPWFWRAAELFSLLFVAILAATALFLRRREHLRRPVEAVAAR